MEDPHSFIHLRKTAVKNLPVTIGIDPAAPNGDHSAMAVIQGNTIHSIVFDDLEKIAMKYMGDPKQLPPLLSKMSGTVTGRITSGSPPLSNLPKMGTPSSDPRYTYYLLRKLEVVATDAGNYSLPAFMHTQGQPGDVLVTRSYMGKYQAYFWGGKKKYYWRRVNSRKYPDLLPQLRAALLLQT